MQTLRKTEPSIAFEFDFPEDAPAVLWRIVSVPAGSPSDLRHAKWFFDEGEARHHADTIRQSRGQLLAFDRYDRSGGKSSDYATGGAAAD
jgi:hypothetical protein